MNKPLAVICGAGVAGLCAAWWIERAGWRVLVAERAPDLRTAGYMMGLSGPGYEVARRMGILDHLTAASYEIAENVYRDRRGREVLRLRYRDVMEGVDYLAIRRTDLVAALAAQLSDSDVELRFNVELTRAVETDDHVSIALSDGTELDAALLIGADGLRSAFRSRLFGSADDCLRQLGYRFAAYDVEDSLDLGADFLSYAEPGHVVEYYALGQGRLAALHVWRSRQHGMIPTAHERFELLRSVSANSHPMVRSILTDAEAAGIAPLVDDLVMVDLPQWSQGRQLLLGDAAHCLTLVSGQGAGTRAPCSPSSPRSPPVKVNRDEACEFHNHLARDRDAASQCGNLLDLQAASLA